jgi:hypothetical protein
MHVHVDQPGADDLARRVDCAGGGGAGFANALDFALFDIDIRYLVEAVGRVYNPPVCYKKLSAIVHIISAKIDKSLFLNVTDRIIPSKAAFSRTNSPPPRLGCSGETAVFFEFVVEKRLIAC